MNAESTRRERRWKRAAFVSAALLSINAAGIACFLGWFMDLEFVHWPTVWQASRAKTPAGVRVSDLIRARATNSTAEPDWHHCNWCQTIYSHAKHVAIKVTVGADEAFLFDWDPGSRRLLPATIRTADRFPELVPSGFAISPLPSVGLDGQLHVDRPCRGVPKT
jgi:hypothetical protein